MPKKYINHLAPYMFHVEQYAKNVTNKLYTVAKWIIKANLKQKRHCRLSHIKKLYILIELKKYNYKNLYVPRGTYKEINTNYNMTSIKVLKY